MWLRWEKHPQFQHHEVFCRTIIPVPWPAVFIYYLTIAKYSQENFHSTLENHENHDSLAQ